MTKKQHSIALRIIQAVSGEEVNDVLAAIEKLGKEWRKTNSKASAEDVRKFKLLMERRLKDGK